MHSNIKIFLLSKTMNNDWAEDDEDDWADEALWVEEFASGRYPEAISHLDLLISANPSNPDPKYYLCRGISQHNLGEYVTAIEDFEKTIASVRQRLKIRFRAQKERGIEITKGEIAIAKEWSATAAKGKTSALIELGRGAEAKTYYKSHLKQEIKEAWQSKDWLETIIQFWELCLTYLSLSTNVENNSP